MEYQKLKQLQLKWPVLDMMHQLWKLEALIWELKIMIHLNQLGSHMNVVNLLEAIGKQLEEFSSNKDQTKQIHFMNLLVFYFYIEKKVTSGSLLGLYCCLYSCFPAR